MMYFSDVVSVSGIIMQILSNIPFRNTGLQQLALCERCLSRMVFAQSAGELSNLFRICLWRPVSSRLPRGPVIYPALSRYRHVSLVMSATTKVRSQSFLYELFSNLPNLTGLTFLSIYLTRCPSTAADILEETLMQYFATRGCERLKELTLEIHAGNRKPMMCRDQFLLLLQSILANHSLASVEGYYMSERFDQAMMLEWAQK